MLKHWLPKGCEFIRGGHDAQFVGRIVAPNGSMLGKSSWKKTGVTLTRTASERIFISAAKTH